MRKSLAFYTVVLDFERLDGDDHLTGPSFSVLARDGDRLILSSHRGDGVFGQAVVITTDNVDALFRQFRERGSTDQSWGAREFVDFNIPEKPTGDSKWRLLTVSGRVSMLQTWVLLVATEPRFIGTPS